MKIPRIFFGKYLKNGKEYAIMIIRSILGVCFLKKFNAMDLVF